MSSEFQEKEVKSMVVNLDRHLNVLVGDCRETLKSIPSESVQMCVTSPPYF